MSTRESIARYAIIINRLRRSPATFKEILETLELESEIQEYNFAISKRTFQRDKETIESLYGIVISFDYSKNVWYIEDEFGEESNIRLLQAFDTFNALKMTNRLPNYIDYERRQPRGTENLSGLLHAIQNNYQISFDYKKFWNNESGTRNVEPLALKESINRWYVVAMDVEKKEIRTFALDRLSHLKISDKKFKQPKEFDVNKMFEHSFGIISSVDYAPEEIVLVFQKPQAEYIKSLPLHRSQKILKETKSEVRFHLKLYITEDFVQEIVSKSFHVKVLQPESLIQKVKEHHEKALRLYK